MKDNDIRPLKSHNIVDGISIHLDSPIAYRKLHIIMQEKDIQHHVYTLQEDKPLRVVFRHVPTEFSGSDIGDDLRDQGSVARMRKPDKSAMPMVLVTNDRLRRQGGGVAIGIKRNLSFTQVNLDLNRLNNTEIVGIEVETEEGQGKNAQVDSYYKITDWDKFKLILSREYCAPEIIENEEDLDNAVAKFEEIVHKALNESTIQVKKRAPNFNALPQKKKQSQKAISVHSS
ncbi:hypothetical protein JTB14_018756 [Gonioctena quinquepunctata]|nr:hypothetical protein JTB14_018756 [Gonioctena quinquepunctata]